MELHLGVLLELAGPFSYSGTEKVRSFNEQKRALLSNRDGYSIRLEQALGSGLPEY